MTDNILNDGHSPAYQPTNYLGLFTVESWREFKRHGGKVMGFTAKKASAAARLQTGDLILCASSLFQVGRTEGSWGLSLAALR